MFRLGAKSDKTRPIMVKFFEKKYKNLIMENLSKLKSYKDRNVGISHDLNKDQRMERNKLVEEAKKLDNDEKGEFVHRVRGSPGNMKIIKIKRNVV